MTVRRLAVIWMFCVVTGALALPPEPTVEETWYVVLFADVPVGFVRDRWERRGGERYYEDYFEIRASRLGNPMELTVHSEEWSDSDGRLLRFEALLSMTGTRMETTGEMRGDSLYVVTKVPGHTRRQAIAWHEGAVSAGSVDERVTAALDAGMKEFRIESFDLQSLSFVDSRYVTRGQTQQEVRGVEEKLLELEQYDGEAQTPSVTYWVNDNRDARKMVFHQMGMSITLEEITAAEVDSFELDPNFDIIRASSIPCAGFDGDPAAVDQMVYELVFSHPLADAAGFNGPNQKVEDAGDDRLVIRVTRDPVQKITETDEKLQVYLRPDRFIQSDDPEIQKVAQSIKKTSDGGDLGVANALAEWVNGHITGKDLGQGFASAVEVLAEREGDCTEHSVLLAALLRASGIPARTVVGLAYDNGALYGHMWTEAYVGQWRTLDALDLVSDPIRIRITAAKDERALDETDMVNAFGVVGGLRARVTSTIPRR